MRKGVAAAAVAIAVAVGGAVLPVSAQAPVLLIDGPARTVGFQQAARLDPPKPTASAQQQVLDLVNAQRAAHGLPALAFDARLELAAQRHSEDQAANPGMWSPGRSPHTGSDGSSLGQRVDRVGFPWRLVAENVAYGYSTPAAVMNGWMNSSGHKANILRSGVTHIGIGLAYASNGTPYWTQVFATHG